LPKEKKTKKSPEQGLFSFANERRKMNDDVIKEIIKYSENTIPKPHFKDKKYDADKKSYSRWAAEEAIGRLLDHPFDDPESVLTKLLFDTLYYSSIGENKQQDEMFRIAYITLYEILDYLREQSFI
jgi:hypothetical protein